MMTMTGFVDIVFCEGVLCYLVKGFMETKCLHESMRAQECVWRLRI